MHACSRVVQRLSLRVPAGLEHEWCICLVRVCQLVVDLCVRTSGPIWRGACVGGVLPYLRVPRAT